MLAMISSSALAAKWKYKKVKDEMSGDTQTLASKNSLNSVNFDFPYQGKQFGTILITDNSENVIFYIQKGQISCSGGRAYGTCFVQVKFDDNKVKNVHAKEIGDDSTTIAITEPDFLSNLKAAKEMKLRVEVFHNGFPVFTFDVSGLKIQSKLETTNLSKQEASSEAAPPISAAPTKNESNSMLTFLRMTPSLTKYSSSAIWIKSVETSQDASNPSAALLGVACKEKGGLAVAVGTEIVLKETFSLYPPLTDVRYFFDADEKHWNWERLGISEASPMTGLDNFLGSLISAKSLRIAFEQKGSDGRKSFTFNLEEQGIHDNLVKLQNACK